MKLATLALVAGGAVLGQQWETVTVHDELRTKSLVLQGTGFADAVLTATSSGGVHMRLGKGDKYGEAEFLLDLDAGGWSMTLSDASGASVKTRVIEGDVSIEGRTGERSASFRLQAADFPQLEDTGRGMSRITFYPGTSAGLQDTGEPCSIGVSGPHGFLRVRKRLDHQFETGTEPLVLWDEVLQLGSMPPISPWVLASK